MRALLLRETLLAPGFAAAGPRLSGRVFRNDPREVAEAFARALEALPGHFERVVFAVYEPRGDQGPDLRAFRERWG